MFYVEDKSSWHQPVTYILFYSLNVVIEDANEHSFCVLIRICWEFGAASKDGKDIGDRVSLIASGYFFYFNYWRLNYIFVIIEDMATVQLLFIINWWMSTGSIRMAIHCSLGFAKGAGLDNEALQPSTALYNRKWWIPVLSPGVVQTQFVVLWVKGSFTKHSIQE